MYKISSKLFTISCLYCLTCITSSMGQTIVTVAGDGTMLDSGDGGSAATATFKLPYSLTFDKRGNLFVGSLGKIRKIDASTGIITTIAGNGINSYGGDGGPATAALLRTPENLITDSAGNLFVADLWDHRIRRIDATTGIITTIAGIGISGFSGDGGPASAAKLNGPNDLAFDTVGNLFITDRNNFRIRKIDATTGIITTVIGAGPTLSYIGEGGPASDAYINPPCGIFFDDTGNLYIGNGANRLWKVDTHGIIRTFAGNGITGSSGDGIPATDATIGPYYMRRDKSGNIFVTELRQNKVRMISPDGIIRNIVGNGTGGYNGDGIPATSALVRYPAGVAIDSCQNLYFADDSNCRIRKVLFFPDCPDTATGLSIPGEYNRSAVHIYPNPVVNEIQVTTNVAATYTLLDAMGRTVLSGHISVGGERIPTTKLTPGLYLMTITDERGKWTKCERIRKE